mmetsp:Transcript_2871/g.4661  ORF Transcript_2871/g.4661 Transcript_2871/m.4661 type:complete len:209 (-) Transcript_2871:278-904(-)
MAAHGFPQGCVLEVRQLAAGHVDLAFDVLEAVEDGQLLGLQHPVAALAQVALYPLQGVLPVAAVAGELDAGVAQAHHLAHQVPRAVRLLGDGLQAHQVQPAAGGDVAPQPLEDPVLLVGAEPVHGPHQVVRQHGVELLTVQQVLVIPVPDHDVILVPQPFGNPGLAVQALCHGQRGRERRPGPRLQAGHPLQAVHARARVQEAPPWTP